MHEGEGFTATVQLPAPCLKGQKLQGPTRPDATAAKAAAARQVWLLQTAHTLSRVDKYLFDRYHTPNATLSL